VDAYQDTNRLQIRVTSSRIHLASACRLLLMAALLSLCDCAPPAKPGSTYSPLILISLDGYRPDYLDRGLSPNLQALANAGVRARALRPAFPTLTFPNHYTIVTGLYPEHHGIVDNRMVDPRSGKRFVYNDDQSIGDPSWWGGEPLWVGVERAGKHAATMFWPGSDVAIGGIRPEHWQHFDAKLSPADRVDRLLSWLDLPRTQRPDFITLYFEQIDHACHDFGPDSPEVDAALREIDAALGRLLDGLGRRGLADAANVVVVSDHGGTAVGPATNVVLDDVVDVDTIDLVNTGVLTGFSAKPGHESEVEHAVLQPQPHMRCWPKTAVPERLHYRDNPRIPPLLCLADDGWLIRKRDELSRPNRHVSRGEHGYDNADPNMRALFVAHGPAFRTGIIVPEFDNVDIYPMLAHILRIAAAPNDGDFNAVKAMLANPESAKN